MKHTPDFMDRDACTLSDRELFDRIAWRIRRQYQFAISDADARAAARNLLGFCQTLVDIEDDLRMVDHPENNVKSGG